MIKDRKLIENKLKNWWNNGDQENPCILISIPPEDSIIPDTNDLFKFWTDIDFRIERSKFIAKESKYYGQAIPFHWLDYMASTMCLALGCSPSYIDKEGVWAHPVLNNIEEINNIKLDFSNFSYNNIRTLNTKLRDSIPEEDPIAFFALEGITDIVSGLYGIENFLIDMLQKPIEVKKAMEHTKRVWISAFNDFKQIIYNNRNPDNGISWAGIWAPGTTFPMQEDLTYMISNRLFKEFCIPHIVDIASVIDFPIYHLDGIGSIQHLDDLLSVTELKAIQWIPGAGNEKIDQWYDLIRKVKDSGKSIQVFAKANEIENLIKAVGPDRLLISVEDCTKNEAEQLMEKYSDNK